MGRLATLAKWWAIHRARRVHRTLRKGEDVAFRGGPLDFTVGTWPHDTARVKKGPCVLVRRDGGGYYLWAGNLDEANRPLLQWWKGLPPCPIVKG